MTINWQNNILKKFFASMVLSTGQPLDNSSDVRHNSGILLIVK